MAADGQGPQQRQQQLWRVVPWKAVVGLGAALLGSLAVFAAVWGSEEAAAAAAGNNGDGPRQRRRLKERQKAKLENQNGELMGTATGAGTPPGQCPELLPERTDLLCALKALSAEYLGKDKVVNRSKAVKWPPRRVHTCAVVSNSGVLKFHKYGSAIDSADYVFRFNDATVKGYEDLVGKMETFRVGNCQMPRKWPLVMNFNAGFTFIQVPCDHPGPRQVPEGFGDILRTFENVKMVLTHQEVLWNASKFIRNNFAKRWLEFGGQNSQIPTTGMVGMLFALNLCDEVRSYGMNSSPRDKTARYHYKSDSQFKNAASPNYHQTATAEKELWRILAVNNRSEVKDSLAVIPGFRCLKCPSASLEQLVLNKIPAPKKR